MTVWLDVDVVKAVIGVDLAADVDTDSLTLFADAARDHVEDRRPDLFVVTVDEETEEATSTYTPGHQVKVAAAMLAWRTYRNRTSPESELKDSDDLGRMLGIGKYRKFGFGGAAVLVDVDDLVVAP